MELNVALWTLVAIIPAASAHLPTNGTSIKPGGVECQLYSHSTSRDGNLTVHEGSELFMSCQCNSARPLPMEWTLNNKVIDDRSSDVDLANSQTEAQSDITIKDISKKREGSLCCTFNGTLITCSQIQVTRSPVVNISYVGDAIGCRTGKEYNETETVLVKCTVSSPIEDYVDRGFMVLYVNNLPTLTHDQDPKRYEMTLVGETIWIKVHTFRQKVHNDDNLHCRWFQEDTKEMLSNSQLHVTFGKCSGPTHSGSSTAVSTTAEATSHNSSEEFATTKSLQTENSNIFSYLGPIIGILILIIVLGSLVLIVKRRKKSSQNKTVNVDVRTVRPNETTSTAAALQQGTGSSDEFITPATNDDLLNVSGGPKEMEESSSIADSQDSVRDNAPTPQVTASLISGHQKRENMEETGSNAGGTNNSICQVQYGNKNNGLGSKSHLVRLTIEHKNWLLLVFVGEATTFSQSMNQEILEALSDGFQQAKKDSQIVLQNQKASLEGQEKITQELIEVKSILFKSPLCSVSVQSLVMVKQSLHGSDVT